MSAIEKLKKKAAEFEQKKQFDRALESYVQIIEHTKGNEEKDVAVYNRVGDLYLRLNKTDQAVHYYEQAVDLYAEGGYLNNAIALCNKILRHAPSRNQIYYKLGKISAKKGFNSDAKKNFLEFADRMHKAGRDTDAFKALEEFADLCPGQDDIRLMLADQLAKAGKTAEAVEQLQILHESLDAGGRTAEATATVKRMHALDPSVQPRRSRKPRATESDGLVFLDLDESPPHPRPKISGAKLAEQASPERGTAPPRPRTPPHIQPSPELEKLSDFSVATPPEAPAIEPETLEIASLDIDLAPLPELEPTLEAPITELELPPIEGLERTVETQRIEGLELTSESSSFAGLEEPSPAREPMIAEPSFDATLAGGTNTGSIDSLTGVGQDEIIPDPLVGIDPRSMDSPFDSADPLAGLSVLEDDRWYQDNPLAGLPGSPDALTTQESPAAEAAEPEPADATPAPAPAPAPDPATAEAAGDDAVDIGTLDLEERPEAEATPEPEPEPEPKRKTPKKGKPAAKKDSDEVEVLQFTPKKNDRFHNPFKRSAQAKKQEGRPSTPRSGTAKTAAPRQAPPAPPAPRRGNAGGGGGGGAGDADFVDLADWLREDTGARSTRMIAADDKRVGDEQADFTDMLEKFKAGVAANVDEEDFDSHYDLGIAYREMGLIDEAIAEFQKALRGAAYRIRAYEALGQCFIDRSEFDVAITVLSRALREQGLEDEDLIGVLYLLGYASEEAGQPRDAAAYYQRVFALDIDFRDVGERLKAMSKAAAR